MSEAKTKNVYEKLQELRSVLAKAPLTKSGNNKYVGFQYVELQDFMPLTVATMEKLKLSSITTIDVGGENADTIMLMICNSEVPAEQVRFMMPFGKATLKGCHEVQNIGASMTYCRRYLWMMALDLSEGDVVDNTNDGKDQTKPSLVKPSQRKPAATQTKQTDKAAGVQVDGLKKIVVNYFKGNHEKVLKQMGISNYSEMTKANYQKIMEILKPSIKAISKAREAKVEGETSGK